MRNVLVTGGQGFLGREVCRGLVESGRLVTATWHTSPPTLTNASLRWVKTDLASAEPLLGLQGIDAVVHLAAVLPERAGGMDAAAEVNRRIDDAVFAWAYAQGIPVIFASGTSVYGESQQSEPLAESTRPAPTNPYTMAKLESEQAGAEFANRSGVAFTALRVCAPYGPEQRARTVLQIFVEAALQNAPLQYYGRGTREQCFTFVADAAQAFVRAVEAPAGTYNIAGEPPITMKELGHLVADLCGASSALVRAAGRPDPQEGALARFDCSLAKRSLGWRPRVSLRAGLALCIARQRNRVPL